MNAAVSDRPAKAHANETISPSVALRPPADFQLVSVLTFVIWSGCLAIGVLGMVLPYLRPQPHVKAAPPVTAELLNVELTNDPLPPINAAPPPPNLAQPPTAVPPAVMLPAKPMIAVAAPSPQIAFTVPIQAPAQVVPVKEASFRTVENPPIVESPAAPLVPQPLIFGQGEGKQPAPEYPRESQRQRQEGSVTVLLFVGEDGRVLSAEASSPSPWPMLDHAAVRVVKNRWRLSPGKVRSHTVTFHFQLPK